MIFACEISMPVKREVTYSLLQRIYELLTREKLRNKTVGEQCLENTLWKTKPVCASGTGKIIEKRGKSSNQCPNCAPNHRNG